MSDEFVKRLSICCVLAASAVPGIAIAQAPKPAAREAEPVGRLFFTPAQRASLDVARSQRARTTLATEQVTEEVAAPTEQTITYSGMVRRNDGKSTVWLNNRPVNDQEAAGGTIVGRVRPDGGVSLQVPQSGRSIDLKPGQSVELLSGTIEEGYSRKPVTPEPKPAAKPEVKPAPDDKGAKPAAARAPAASDPNEERQRERLQEAIAEALRENAARGGSVPAAPAAQPTR
jgi:hypothetical protein